MNKVWHGVCMKWDDVWIEHADTVVHRLYVSPL